MSNPDRAVRPVFKVPFTEVASGLRSRQRADPGSTLQSGEVHEPGRRRRWSEYCAQTMSVPEESTSSAGPGARVGEAIDRECPGETMWRRCMQWRIRPASSASRGIGYAHEIEERSLNEPAPSSGGSPQAALFRRLTARPGSPAGSRAPRRRSRTDLRAIRGASTAAHRRR